MKLAIATTLLTTAAAFAPTSKTSTATATALNAAIDEAFGTTVETGFKCPPLGAKILEGGNPESIKWFQNAEIKHGRVAMIATIGYMVQKMGVHFPLYLGPSGSNCFHPESDVAWYLSTSAGVTFSDVAHAATPLDAVQMVPAAGWLQVFFAAGLFEATAFNRQWNQEGRVPGDYGYDPLGFTKREGGWDSEELKSLRIKEIKNGRLAMMTMAAWVSNDLIPGALPVWHP